MARLAFFNTSLVIDNRRISTSLFPKVMPNLSTGVALQAINPAQCSRTDPQPPVDSSKFNLGPLTVALVKHD